MSNVAVGMGKPATPLVHPRIGYAYSALKVRTVKAMPVGEFAVAVSRASLDWTAEGGCPHMVRTKDGCLHMVSCKVFVVLR
jgi:hypothetical protein